MVSGISQNYGNYSNVGFAGAQAPAADKKSSTATKAAVATVGTAVVAGATLYGLVKTGKLNKALVENGWKSKLQNIAYTIGSKIGKGVEAFKNSSVTKWVKDKASSLVSIIKGWFNKKDLAKTADKVVEASSNAVSTAAEKIANVVK